MTDRRNIAFEADLHAAWKAAAEKEGLSLAAYVTRAVEAVRSGEAVRPQPKRKMLVLSTQVAPQDCTNRVPPGTWCKVCGSIHGKAKS